MLSRSPGKKADAHKLGAHDFVPTQGQQRLWRRWPTAYDVIVDTISAKHDINGPLGCLKRDGTLILVGASPQTLDLSPFALIFGRRKVMGSAGGRDPPDPGNARSLRDPRDHERHRDHHAARDQRAYERTLRGDVKYRFVVDARSSRSGVGRYPHPPLCLCLRRSGSSSDFGHRRPGGAITQCAGGTSRRRTRCVSVAGSCRQAPTNFRRPATPVKVPPPSCDLRHWYASRDVAWQLLHGQKPRVGYTPSSPRAVLAFRQRRQALASSAFSGQRSDLAVAMAAMNRKRKQ